MMYSVVAADVVAARRCCSAPRVGAGVGCAGGRLPSNGLPSWASAAGGREQGEGER